MKSSQIFLCPSDSGRKYTPGRPVSNYEYGSYAINNAYWPDNDNRTGVSNVTLSQIANSAQTVYAVDYSGNMEFAWDSPANNPVIQNTSPRTMADIPERHLETTNVLWCDGHVKATRLSTLAATKAVGGQPVMTLFTIEDD
jgi:prepilin-type processing-associated H-X9-DG protein